MPLYPVRALERAMKIKEVITRAMSGQFTWGPGCRDHRNHGSEHAAVAKTIEHGRLRGAAGSEDPSTECETDRHHGRGESLAALSGEIFRFECEALRGEAARRGTDFPELYVGEDGTAECRPCPAIPEAGTAPQKASTSATDGDDAACGWQPASMDSRVGSISGLGGDFRRCH